MVHARSFSQIETLRSGVSITIRAVRFTDKDGIASAFSRLDHESIYARFFQSKIALCRELQKKIIYSMQEFPILNEKRGFLFYIAVITHSQ